MQTKLSAVGWEEVQRTPALRAMWNLVELQDRREGQERIVRQVEQRGARLGDELETRTRALGIDGIRALNGTHGHRDRVRALQDRMGERRSTVDSALVYAIERGAVAICDLATTTEPRVSRSLQPGQIAINCAGGWGALGTRKGVQVREWQESALDPWYWRRLRTWSQRSLALGIQFARGPLARSSPELRNLIKNSKDDYAQSERVAEILRWTKAAVPRLAGMDNAPRGHSFNPVEHRGSGSTYEVCLPEGAVFISPTSNCYEMDLPRDLILGLPEESTWSLMRQLAEWQIRREAA